MLRRFLSPLSASIVVSVLAMLTTGICSADSLSEALRAKRYQDVLTTSDSLLKKSPGQSSSWTARLWTARALALKGLGRDRESVSSFETALQYSPDSLPALQGIVEVTYRSRDPRASSFLDQLIRRSPENGVAQAMAGVLAFEAGKYQLALQHFGRSGAETSRNEQAYFLYGACLLMEHRYSEAIPTFEQSLAAHSDSDNVRFDLGYAQLLAGKPADAVETLRPFANEVNAGAADALNLLASAEIYNGQVESAIAHLHKAVELAPKEEQNYIDLTVLCIQHDMLKAADEIAEAGSQSVPASARLHALRGVINAQSGKYEEAAADFERANELDPETEYGATGLGVLYTEMNQPDKAISVIDERLRNDPNNAMLNYFLAEALMRQATVTGSLNFASTRNALLTAVRLKPDLAKAHSLLGKLYLRGGDYQQAVNELQLALQYDPADRMALSQLAIAFRHLGHSSEASAALKKLKDIIVMQSQSVAPAQNRIRIAHDSN